MSSFGTILDNGTSLSPDLLGSLPAANWPMEASGGGGAAASVGEVGWLGAARFCPYSAT